MKGVDRRHQTSHVYMKSHYGGPKIVVTFYCFLKYPCVNFNHVIIKKDFYNVFAHYGRLEHIKSIAQKNRFFISYDVMLQYIHHKLHGPWFGNNNHVNFFFICLYGINTHVIHLIYIVWTLMLCAFFRHECYMHIRIV